MKEDRYPHALAGLAMGGGAILLWSLSSACVVFAGRRMGVWQFLVVASLTGGLLQVVGYLALGRSLRSVLLPPPKLWFAVALGFVVYLLLYTTGLMTSRTETQAVGVSLTNYLWPTLAILFSTWLVPGERMHGRLATAIGLSLGGVVLANGLDIALPESGVAARPWVLGGGAAVSWAAYCAQTSRWRHWAKGYAAAPLGFLIVGAVALVVCCWDHEWRPMNGRTWGAVLLIAVGPWAGGYMLWEMALHRVSVVTLGLMGSATPVLSTVGLIALFALTGTGRASGMRLPVLLAASVMIGASVALGKPSSGRR